MTPHKMLHYATEGYGDCLRTCIACLLDMSPLDVPHFAAIGPDDPDAVWKAVDEFLASHGLACFFAALPGDMTLSDILDGMATMNSGTYYMLAGANGNGNDHVVIALDSLVVHDPAWSTVELSGPGSTGIWLIVTLISDRMKER